MLDLQRASEPEMFDASYCAKAMSAMLLLRRGEEEVYVMCRKSLSNTMTVNVTVIFEFALIFTSISHKLQVDDQHYIYMLSEQLGLHSNRCRQVK